MTISSLVLSLRRRIPLSREGLGWLVLSVAMLLTGLIKSINLITLLACILLAVGLVNMLFAWRQVRGLSVQREIPDFLVALTANPWSVRIRQTSRRARHGLMLVDPWPESPLTWIVDLSANADQTCVREIVAPKRGIVALGPTVVRSSYPFGLASLERAAGEAATIHIAPRLGQLQRGLLRRWLSRRSPSIGAIRSRPIRHPSGQMEFHGLRTFRSGDSPRLIHWRTSARRGELMVREFEEYPNDDLVLIVDLSLPNPAEVVRFERMLSLAATIAWEWCRQKGDWLTVVLAGTPTRRLSGATGAILRAEVMRGLAAAHFVAQADCETCLSALYEAPAPATAHLLLSVGASALVEPLQANLRHVLATVDLAAAGEGEFFEIESASRGH